MIGMVKIAYWIQAVLLIVLAAQVSAAEELSPSKEQFAERANAFELMTAAAAASGSNDPTEAGFCFIAAQIRFKIDKEVYPPVGKGGNSPDALKAALSMTVGQAAMPDVLKDADAFAAVVKRLTAWTPIIDERHDPGWKYSSPLKGNAVTQAIREAKAEALGPMERKATLYSDAEYRRLAVEAGETQATRMRLLDEAELPFDGATSEKLRQLEGANTAALLRMKEIEWRIDPESRWHRRMGWKASNYFTDRGVIELCEAIERDDLESMDRLIAVGVDVDARGKEGMTPLLWAMPDGKVARFERLLRGGADPNVVMQSDFGAEGQPLQFSPHNSLARFECMAGRAVTHLACLAPETAHLRLVLTLGGDAKLTTQKEKMAPLDFVIGMFVPQSFERVELLLEAGADPNRYCEYEGAYPVVCAIRANAYDVALLLLKAGADFNAKQPRNGETVIHAVLKDERHLPFTEAKQAAEYAALTEWLEEKNAPFATVRAELDRGPVWGRKLREQEDKEMADFREKENRLAEQRAERLAELKRQPPVKLPTTAERVRRLTEEQLAALRLPEDHKAKVFVLRHSASRFTDQEPPPSLVVYADGKIECRTLFTPFGDPQTRRLSEAKLTWLLHLAVNECGLLNKESSGFDDINTGPHNGYFDYAVNLASGENEFRLPEKALVLKVLRAQRGLYSFKELHAYINELTNRTQLGEQAAPEVLKEVNDELRAKDPLLPPFTIEHLQIAQRDSEKLICGFEREIDLGDNRYEQVHASYLAKKEEAPKIVIGQHIFHRLGWPR
jgi:ankyrin repeat protein